MPRPTKFQFHVTNRADALVLFSVLHSCKFFGCADRTNLEKNIVTYTRDYPFVVFSEYDDTSYYIGGNMENDRPEVWGPVLPLPDVLTLIIDRNQGKHKIKSATVQVTPQLIIGVTKDNVTILGHTVGIDLIDRLVEARKSVS